MALFDKTIATLRAVIKADTKELDTGIKKSTKSAKDFGKLISGAAFAGAITLGVEKAIDSFAAFEEKMLSVQTLLDGDAKRTIQGFTKDILKLTEEIPLAAEDMADALFDVVSAGIPAGEAIEFLAESSKLAVAGVTDAKTAVDGMTSAYNAFRKEGLKANEIADRFFAAQKRGKTTIAELSSSIGRVAPTASAMNISLDETLGIISDLTLKGIKTDEAVTGLKAAIQAIAAPSEEAKDAAATLGIVLSEQALKSEGLFNILKDVKKGLDETGGAYTDIFPNVRALNAVLALTNDNMENAIKITDELTNSVGISNEKFKEQTEGMKSQIILLKNELQALTIETVDFWAPMITSGIKFIRNLGKIEDAIDSQDKAVKEFDRTNFKSTKEFEDNLKKKLELAREEIKLSKEKEKSSRHLTNLEIAQSNERTKQAKKHYEEVKIEVLAYINWKKEQDISETNNFEDLENKKTEKLKTENNKRIEEIRKESGLSIKLAQEKINKTKELEELTTEAYINMGNAAGKDYVKKLEEAQLKQDDLFKAGLNSVNDYEKTLKDFVTGFIASPDGLFKDVSNSLTNLFGDVGTFVGGAIGGVVATGIANIIQGLFGDRKTKTVAQYAEEAFDRMVRNTNRALDQIGKEQTRIGKQISILELLGAEKGLKARVPENLKAFLEVLGDKTIEQALIDKQRIIQDLNKEEDQAIIDAVKRAEERMKLADKFLKQENELGRFPKLHEFEDWKKQISETLGLVEEDRAKMEKLLRAEIRASRKFIEEKKPETAITSEERLTNLLENLLIERDISDILEKSASGVQKFAKGGSFIVNKPTFIPTSKGGAIVGERGPETLTVTPGINKGISQGSSVTINNTFNITESLSPERTASIVKSEIDNSFFVSTRGVNQTV